MTRILIAILVLFTSLSCFGAPPRKWDIESARVVDGDTVAVVLQLGFDLTYKVKVRCANVDAPEHSTEAGKAVIAVVKKWMSDREGKLSAVYVAGDKYVGRFDGEIVDAKGQTLSAFLIDNKLAREYRGGTRKAWTSDELDGIKTAANALMK